MDLSQEKRISRRCSRSDLGRSCRGCASPRGLARVIGGQLFKVAGRVVRVPDGPQVVFTSRTNSCDDADEVGADECALVHADPPQMEVHDGFLLDDAEQLVLRVVRGLGFVLCEAVVLRSGRAADSTARDDVVLDRGQL